MKDLNKLTWKSGLMATTEVITLHMKYNKTRRNLRKSRKDQEILEEVLRLKPPSYQAD